MSVHTLFDTYIMVDWSAKDEPGPRDSKPGTQKKDNIWIGEANRLGDDLSFSQTYCRTRARAYHHLEMRLQDLHKEKRQVLVGFDFAFGYPAGFAELLTGKASWKAVWEYLAEHLLDDELNENNRFHLAGKLNSQVPGNGPFWGKPREMEFDNLTATSPWKGVNELPFGDTILQRLRYTDQATKGTQSVWKLYGAGSVGSQSLTGIPVVWQLKQLKSLAKDSFVWPFENNFLKDNNRKKGRIVYAEIFPTLANDKVQDLMQDTAANGSKPKDQLQVWAMTELLAKADDSGELKHWLEAPQHYPAAVCTEEAAILQKVNIDTLPQQEDVPAPAKTEPFDPISEPKSDKKKDVGEKAPLDEEAKKAEKEKRKAEKEAAKATAKAEKEATKATAKTEKEAERDARKAEKEKEKAALKAEREAEKAKREAEKEKQRKAKEASITKESEGRKAEKIAEKAELKAKREQEKADKEAAKAAKIADKEKARAGRDATRTAKRAAKEAKKKAPAAEVNAPSADPSDAEE